jgi:hypothetical protein
VVLNSHRTAIESASVVIWRNPPHRRRLPKSGARSRRDVAPVLRRVPAVESRNYVVVGYTV